MCAHSLDTARRQSLNCIGENAPKDVFLKRHSLKENSHYLHLANRKMRYAKSHGVKPTCKHRLDKMRSKQYLPGLLV